MKRNTLSRHRTVAKLLLTRGLLRFIRKRRSMLAMLAMLLFASALAIAAEKKAGPPLSIIVNTAGRPELWVGAADVTWDFAAASDPSQSFAWAAIHSGPTKGLYRYRLPYPIIETAPDPIPPSPAPGPQPPTPPTPTPTPIAVNPYQPLPEWKATCQPLAGRILSRADATALATVYATLADDVAKAASPIKTSADLRTAIVDRGKPLGLQGKYAGLAAAVEKAMADSLGLEIYNLDQAKTASFLKTLAWAAWEAGTEKGGK